MLFKDEISIKSKLDLDSLVKSLSFNLAENNLQSSTLTHYKFTGKISKKNFTIRRKKYLGRNSFIPEGEGSFFQDDENEVIVRIKVRFSRWTNYFLVTFFVVAIVFQLTPLFSAPSSSPILEPEMLAQIKEFLSPEELDKLTNANQKHKREFDFTGLLIPLAFIVFIQWNFMREVKILKEWVKGLLA